MLRIGTTVLGVDDVERAIEFWTAALHYRLKGTSPDGQFAILIPDVGRRGAALAVDLSESQVQLHPRVHLDLWADDQQAEVERLVGLGASRVDWDLYPENPDFVVLADPSGNRFCVIDAGEHAQMPDDA